MCLRTRPLLNQIRLLRPTKAIPQWYRVLPRKNLNEWSAGRGPFTDAVTVKAAANGPLRIVDRTGAKTILSSLSTQATSAILIQTRPVRARFGFEARSDWTTLVGLLPAAPVCGWKGMVMATASANTMRILHVIRGAVKRFAIFITLAARAMSCPVFPANL